MHSDWHRYNLKRRVASLPPLPSEVFAEKVLTAQLTSTAAAAKASFEKACVACQKIYYSENAYQNHLGSQKHKVRMIALQHGGVGGVDTETESVMSSTFSLGTPAETGSIVTEDPEAEAEFSKVVDGIKETTLTELEPVSQRPTRPHHSSVDDRSEHPLSPSDTEDSTPAPTNESDSREEVPLARCLFCNYDSPSLPLNILHMGKIHGMFIPEKSYLVDLEGLLGHLYEKITDLHECLYCSKVRNTRSGIQTHMRDKGHCMIGFESEEDMVDIGQFYDFRSTYSEEDDDDDDDDDEDMEEDESGQKSSGGVKLGAKRDGEGKMTVNRGVAGDDGGDVEMEDEDGEGWETDSSASSLDSADLTAVPLDHTHISEKLQRHRHHAHQDSRPHRDVDGFHSHAHHRPYAVYHSDYELHLPSGRTAGHRSLAKYYRQNLHNYPTQTERIEQRAITEASNSSTEGEEQGGQDGRGRQVITRANGGMGMVGVTDAKKKEVKAVEKRERKREQRARANYQWGVDKRGNSQKHFRDPLLQ
ncbi:MAG: hypothetical protein M1827_007150 [Pycnora praestabilis]|nr:MAG: hypothetical protein M1827_007150 [Pycnora praestabilis]